MAQAFLLTLAALVAFMSAQLAPRTLEHIWCGCIFFFGARFLQSGARLAWLWRNGGLDQRAEGEESGGESGEEEGQGEEGAAEGGSGNGQQQRAGGMDDAARRRIAASPDPSGGQLELAP